MNDPEPQVKLLATRLIVRLAHQNHPLAVELYHVTLNSILMETSRVAVGGKTLALKSVTQNTQYVLPIATFIQFIQLIPKYFKSFSWTEEMWFLVEWCVRRVSEPFVDIECDDVDQRNEPLPVGEFKAVLDRVNNYNSLPEEDLPFIKCGHYEFEGFDVTTNGLVYQAVVCYDLHPDGVLLGTVKLSSKIDGTIISTLNGKWKSDGYIEYISSCGGVFYNYLGYMNEDRSEGVCWARINDTIDYQNSTGSDKGIYSYDLILQEDSPRPKEEKSDGSTELLELLNFFVDQLEQGIVRFYCN